MSDRHEEPHRFLLCQTMGVYHTTQLRTYSLDRWVRLVVSICVVVASRVVESLLNL
jgi:hypothetical protein